MGDIGDDQREYEVEPMREPAVPEPAPAPAPKQPEPVPA